MDNSQRILLLTDFSEVSENATDYALQIAKTTPAAARLHRVVSSTSLKVLFPQPKY